jgi:hypothetical protein
MTALLLVIIVLVGLVALIDLTLIYALIRRVNEIQSNEYDGGSNYTHPESGYRIGGFATQTIDGLQVSERDLQGAYDACGLYHDRMFSLNPATPVRRWRSASGPAMLGIGIETARDPNRDRDVPQPKP